MTKPEKVHYSISQGRYIYVDRDGVETPAPVGTQNAVAALQWAEAQGKRKKPVNPRRPA